jgi:8-oxo-dGTP pyrophosphatase MutT (NUDIX family)
MEHTDLFNMPKLCIHTSVQPLIPYMQHKRYPRRIQCINCGLFGHTARKCNEPVTSYGIICFHKNMNGDPEYLMIQKKDSLSYVEFVRGKYDVFNKDYLLRLVSNMTIEEKERLRTKTFDEIWNMLWTNDVPQSKRFTANYNDAKKKFEKLSIGFLLRDEKENSVVFFNIQYILDNARQLYHETEWEFPKGRRQLNEFDEQCALREFSEETGILPSSIKLLREIKPLEEIFVGMNKIRYRHIYYVAFAGPSVEYKLDEDNVKQTSEVRNIAWCSISTALEKTRPLYVERKEVLLRIHRMLFSHETGGNTPLPPF